jgi:hypothetical protein
MPPVWLSSLISLLFSKGPRFLAGKSCEHQLAVMSGLSQIKVLTRVSG